MCKENMNIDYTKTYANKYTFALSHERHLYKYK